MALNYVPLKAYKQLKARQSFNILQTATNAIMAK